jgi:hypothetical protein
MDIPQNLFLILQRELVPCVLIFAGGAISFTPPPPVTGTGALTMSTRSFKLPPNRAVVF